MKKNHISKEVAVMCIDFTWSYYSTHNTHIIWEIPLRLIVFTFIPKFIRCTDRGGASTFVLSGPWWQMMNENIYSFCLLNVIENVIYLFIYLNPIPTHNAYWNTSAFLKFPEVVCCLVNTQTLNLPPLVLFNNLLLGKLLFHVDFPTFLSDLP